MPRVYSDPLHEDIKIMLESVLKTEMDQKTKKYFQEMLEKISAAPIWRPGQAYANPTHELVKVKSKS